MRLGNTAGFTLIELTIVVAGLIVAIILLPAVQSTRNERVTCSLSPSECQMTVGPGQGGK